MKIGLTYTGFKAKHNNYYNWLRQSDYGIEIITLIAEKNNLQELEICNGLVLSGGVDISPFVYGQNEDYAERPEHFDKERDVFEMACFKWARQNKLPVLGICRGLQLINCVLGGTLQQDLGQANSIHKAIVERRQYDKAHALHIFSDNYLFKLNNADRAVVNSAHHQAVKKIADELVATCISDDGIVEGLEWKDKRQKPFLLCVQWHPERMFEFNLEQTQMGIGVRNLFIEAIKSELTT